ncbi:MAG: hypothetical protein BWX52_01617 [Bacteroidetes bacterium ADurb.Bin013]|nr:MAG: hypothetical protein BWX52_01617 [Bacteroidetes bacterium ADurb.Bin013]
MLRSSTSINAKNAKSIWRTALNSTGRLFEQECW